MLQGRNIAAVVVHAYGGACTSRSQDRIPGAPHRRGCYRRRFCEDRGRDRERKDQCRWRLNVLDEFTHECLAIRVARKLKAIDVIDVLSDLFILRGIPAFIRSDNGPEFLAKAVQEWIAVVGAKTASIERGSPWENGYIESFNARLRDKLLDGEIFYTLREAQIVIESWRRHYNTISPHASLGYKPPAPQVFVPAFAATASLKLTFHLDHSVGADHSAPGRLVGPILRCSWHSQLIPANRTFCPWSSDS